MADKSEENHKSEKPKPAVTLAGKVEKVIPSIDPSEPEKIQIAVDGADDLYREIRVENELHDANGNVVAVKKGAEVDVTIEADHTAIKDGDLRNQSAMMGGRVCF